jgi:hypothetical protein
MYEPSFTAAAMATALCCCAATLPAGPIADASPIVATTVHVAPAGSPDDSPSLVRLAPAAGGRLAIIADGGETTYTLAHWPHSVRSGGFRAHAQLGDGSLMPIAVQTARTFRGVIEEAPGSVVAGSLGEDGSLRASIIMPGGRLLRIEPALAGSGLHEMRDAGLSAAARQAAAAASGEEVGCVIAQVAIDADFQLFTLYGSDAEALIDHIEALVNAVNIQYESEVGIVHEITEILIRTSPAEPYTTNDASTLLQQFRSVWNAEPLASIERDFAHLFTGRNLTGNVASVAFIGVVCNVPLAYGLTRDLAIDFECMSALLARTFGVMWSASACDCPGTTMHQQFSCANTFIGPGSNSVDEIIAFRDSRDCLDPCPGGCAPADLNCDGVVDVFDLLALLGSWGPCAEAGSCPADLNGDVVVDVFDLLLLLGNWG